MCFGDEVRQRTAVKLEAFIYFAWWAEWAVLQISDLIFKLTSPTIGLLTPFKSLIHLAGYKHIYF